MKIKTITSTRLVLEGFEKDLRLTWGDDWERMRKDERKLGAFTVLLGSFSKGASYAPVVVHAEYVPPGHADRMALTALRFGNGSVINVSAAKLTIEQLVGRRLYRRSQYADIIRAGRESQQEVYDVPSS